MFNITLLLPAFALVLARVSGLMIVAPVLGSSVIPVRVRAALALALSLMIFPIVLPTIDAELTLSSAVIGLVGELMIGIVLGLGLSLLFIAMELAGQMIAQQAGLAIGEVFDPVLQTSVSPLGQLYFMSALFVFLFAGGLRAMVQGLLDSFGTLPLMTFGIKEPVVEVMADLLMSSMILALRISGPAVTALLLTSVAMGLISRTMPQLNILAVGFSIRIVVSLLIVAATLASIEPLINTYLWRTFDALMRVLQPAP